MFSSTKTQSSDIQHSCKQSPRWVDFVNGRLVRRLPDPCQRSQPVMASFPAFAHPSLDRPPRNACDDHLFDAYSCIINHATPDHSLVTDLGLSFRSRPSSLLRAAPRTISFAAYLLLCVAVGSLFSLEQPPTAPASTASTASQYRLLAGYLENACATTTMLSIV